MSTRRALAFSFIDRYSGLVIHTVSAMVVARLLTPAEIGVYSVVMVLLGFVAVFRDFGAGQYLVQRAELTPEVKRATWTMQAGLGLAFALAVFAGAAPLALFFADARVETIMHVLALNFLVTPFLAFPNALLVREMQFGTLAVIRFVGGIGHATVAIGAAWLGHGAISLAWANLTTTVLSIAATVALTRLPLWQRPTTRGLRAAISFGGSMTAVSLLHTVRTGSAEFVLGKLQSLTAAGLMSRAQGLVAMFQQLVIDAVGSVALPYFAGELRAGNSLGRPFLRMSELVLGLGWSFFAVLALLAFPVVRLLYGGQWDDAVLPCRWLALAALAGLPGLVCQPPLIALGAMKQVTLAAAVSAGLALLAVAGGAAFGTVVVAQALVLAGAASTATWLVLAKRRLGFSWADYVRSLGRTARVAAASAVCPVLLVLVLGWRPTAHPALVLVVVLPSTLCMLAALFAVKHELASELRHYTGALRRRFGMS